MKYKLHKLEQFRHIKRIGKCDTLSIGNAKVVWIRVEEEVHGDMFFFSYLFFFFPAGALLIVFCKVGSHFLYIAQLVILWVGDDSLGDGETSQCSWVQSPVLWDRPVMWYV